MKLEISLLSLMAAAGLQAAPVVSVPVVSAQDDAGRMTVSYDLSGEDAIVTAELLVDGEPYADKAVPMAGDVNRKVVRGTGKTFTVYPAQGGVASSGTLTVRLKAWSLDNPPDYLTISLTTPKQRRYYATAEAVPQGIGADIYKTDILLMRKIPATGVTWRMGQPYPDGENCSSGSGAGNTKADILDNETGHMVRLTNDFYAAIYPMTQLQYHRLTGAWTTQSYESIPLPDRYVTPVAGNNSSALSYNALRGTPDASFKGWPQSGHAVKPGSVLAAIRDYTGVSGLDLPTEAEWEYACRAGTGTSLNSGKNVSDPISGRHDANMAEVGWMQYINPPKLKSEFPVGLKKPNAWGLYDCHGNVGELCLDWYATGTVYRATFASGWETGVATVAPVGSANEDGAITTRITRGGDWFYSSSWARSASRRLSADPTKGTYHNGFRLFCRTDFEKAQ